MINNYYQVFKVIPEKGTIMKDRIIFEDQNCMVFYNFWTEDGGNVGFSIYNKTEQDLILDFTQTFFILNGVAYDYYQNSSITRTSMSGTTLSSISYPYYYYPWVRTPVKYSGTSSTSYSNTYVEKPQLIVPPNTQRTVSQFRVANYRYLNCDLLKAPSPKRVKTIKFEKSSSPYVFYNLITYKIGKDSVRMENRFFVAEICNKPESQMVISVDTNACGKSLSFPEKIFKDVTPDKFYFRYRVED
jgi:hypothetical protein